MKETKYLVIAASFLAIGLLLPFFTGQIPYIGSKLLPMHFPVLLCGMICGWKYGGLVGGILPLLRNMLFGMPPLFPTGMAMSFELAAYGITVGVLYQWLEQKNFRILLSVCGAMIAGRIVWGILMLSLLQIQGQGSFTFQLFITGAFIKALPGILLQLLIIPLCMKIQDQRVKAFKK